MYEYKGLKDIMLIELNMVLWFLTRGKPNGDYLMNIMFMRGEPVCVEIRGPGPQSFSHV